MTFHHGIVTVQWPLSMTRRRRQSYILLAAFKETTSFYLFSSVDYVNSISGPASLAISYDCRCTWFIILRKRESRCKDTC